MNTTSSHKLSVSFIFHEAKKASTEEELVTSAFPKKKTKNNTAHSFPRQKFLAIWEPQKTMRFYFSSSKDNILRTNAALHCYLTDVKPDADSLLAISM